MISVQNWLRRPQNQALVVCLLLFLLLRLPSLWEPAWYGDEGIYAAVGRDMARGETLYIDTWDHKPPAIYLLFAATHWLGSWQLPLLKLINLALGLTVLYGVYKLVLMLTQSRLNELSAARRRAVFLAPLLLVVFLFGGTAWEGNTVNAESFFVPLALLAVLDWLYAVVRKQPNTSRSWLRRGLILGLALTFKFHPGFDAIALGWGLVAALVMGEKSVKDIKKLATQNWAKFAAFAAGGALPLALCGLFYFIVGHFTEFWFTVVRYNFGYSDDLASRTGLLASIDSVGGRMVLLGIVLVILLWLVKRGKLTLQLGFILSWLACTFIAARISERPYPHYLLQLVPPLAGLLALAMLWAVEAKRKVKSKLVRNLGVFLVFFVFLLVSFAGNLSDAWGYLYTSYYSKSYGVILGIVNRADWEGEFGEKELAYQQLESWLSSYRGAELFIWGDYPWLFVRGDFENAVRYPTYYHIRGGLVPTAMADLTKSRPELIVIDSTVAWELPREVSGYIQGNYALVAELGGRFSLWLPKGDLLASL